MVHIPPGSVFPDERDEIPEWTGLPNGGRSLAEVCLLVSHYD